MQNNDSPKQKENKWLADRSMGIMILLISCGVAIFTIIRPIMGMLDRNEDVLYSTNLIAITILGILFGLAYSLLGGENLNKLIDSQDSKGVVRVVIFTLIFFGILFGLMMVWNSFAISLGY